MIFASIFCVAITAACVSAATSTVTCPTAETGLGVYFPHESDCSKFYQCIGGTPHLHECPAGLHFNPAYAVCGSPDQAGCSTSKSTESDLASARELQEPPLEGQKCMVAKKSSSLKPHPSDCRKFVECFLGRTMVWSCLPDDLFHPKMLMCVPPSFVRCNAATNFTYY